MIQSGDEREKILQSSLFCLNKMFLSNLIPFEKMIFHADFERILDPLFFSPQG